MTTQVNSTVLGTLGNLTITDRVGIATTTPAARLEVNGIAYFGSSNNVVGGGFQIQGKSTANWNFGQLDLYRNATNATPLRFIGLMLDGDDRQTTTVGAYNSIWGAYDSAPTTSSNSSALNGAMVYGAYAGHQWVTNGTERMRITSAGGISFGETGTAYGTSGQILKSNGNSPPSWNSLASFTEFDKSLATDGYQKLPGGLIIQWGTTGVIAGPGTATITFPIVFTTSCFNVQITIKDESGDTSSTGIVAARSVTTTGFILRNGDDPNMIFNWLAIGY